MSNDRVIKTDGDLDITATDTSVSGTLTVSGQATLSGIAYPTADGALNQVIKTNGSGALSFGDATGRKVTLSNQTEANAYTPAEQDLVLVTGNVSLTSQTLTHINFIISDTKTLTIDQGTITGCTFLGHKVVCKAGSSHTSSGGHQTSGFETIDINHCKFNCGTVEFLQELVDMGGVVDFDVKNTHIYCNTYRYYLTASTVSDQGDDDTVTSPSSFMNVQIIALEEGDVTTGNNQRATADFFNVLVTSAITLATERDTLSTGPINHLFGDTEVGGKTNCKKITLTSA